MQIKPHILAQLSDLELAARLIAEGYLFGNHAGQRLGMGVEFAQYRAYGPDDDARRIDWRRFGQTRKAYVKESELDADYRIWLLVDDSASMAQQSQKGALSKMDYAKYLAASLAYIAHRQEDQFGLLTLGQQAQIRVAPSSSRTQWYRVLSALDQLKPMNGPDPEAGRYEGLPEMWEQTRGSLLILISDFYQHNNEIERMLTGLLSERCECLALCLESDDEINLPPLGACSFKDLETSQTVITATEQVRKQYQAEREAYFENISTSLAGLGVAMQRLNIDKEMDVALRFVLQQWRRQP